MIRSLFCTIVLACVGTVSAQTITYTDADFMTSAAMRNALVLLSSDIREAGTSEGEARYVVKGGLVSAKIRVLIKFIKALRGEAVS